MKSLCPAAIVQWDVNTKLNQQFRFLRNDNGTYKIQARESGLYVRTENWDYANFKQDSSATNFQLETPSGDYLELFAHARPTAVGKELQEHDSPIISAPTTRMDASTRFKLVPKEQVLDLSLIHI